MKTLAAQLAISDVGLKKTCARAMIPTPDRGYWAKRQAGKRTEQIALPSRPPGMSDEVVVAGGSSHWQYLSSDEELRGQPPCPPEFPEPLDAVRERIARVLGRVTVPQKVTIWHPVIDQLVKENEQRREQDRFALYRTPWNGPRFDSVIERRRLRILNSLFFAVSKMFGKPTISSHEPHSMCVSFFQEHVGIALEQPVQPRNRKQLDIGAPKLSPSIRRSIS